MRCYVPPEHWQAGELSLPPEEVHHLRTVMRERIGASIVAFDGAGRSADCEIIEMNRRHARLRVIQQHVHPRPEPEFTLVQGLPREQKMDLLIQKATELGALSIRPVRTDHSVVRLREDHEESKRGRWQRIALNAAKQCGANWVPIVEPVRPLLACLAEMPRVDLLLVCSLEPDAQPLREVLQAARETRPRSVAALVGPEGDFSARERAAARNAGGRAVRLGDSILRSETAALFVLSVLSYELGGAL
jgi:16S rRNA (uracil1498-N3)-methyltransferase